MISISAKMLLVIVQLAFSLKAATPVTSPNYQAAVDLYNKAQGIYMEATFKNLVDFNETTNNQYFADEQYRILPTGPAGTWSNSLPYLQSKPTFDYSQPGVVDGGFANVSSTAK